MTQPLDPHPWPVSSADEQALTSGIVASASDAIMALDRNGRVVVWNLGCEQLFGWSAHEMRGRSAAVLLPERRREEFVRVLHALEGIPESAALETERVHKSGAILPISCRVSPVFDETGRVVGTSAVVRDNGREIELRGQLDEARQLAEARFTQSVIAQATLTPDAFILDVNPALCRLTGYQKRDLLGRPVVAFMADEDVDAATAGLALLAAGDSPGTQHPRLLRHADGRLLETRVSVFPVRDERSGRVLRLEAVVEDVSVAAAAERELQLREARWQSMAVHSSDVALFCDAGAQLLFVSAAVTSVFGYRPEEVLHGDGWSFIHPEDEPGVRAVWDAVAAGPAGTTQTIETRIRHANGSWRWVEESVTNHLHDPAVEAIVVNLVDITERKAAEAVLDELAGTDSLTGLSSRAPLMAALDAAFAGGLAGSTAIAVVDVARMKLINDSHGHRVGDEVLYDVAARLRAALATQRVVARLGGDRFAVLLHDVADIADVFEVSAALLAAFDAPFAAGDKVIRIEVSIGAALGPAVESGALLASAEAALTVAKEHLTGPMHVVRAESASAAVSRGRLVEDLRRGLKQDELVVHFQPVISLTDGRPVAAEALVRWEHPDKGLLSPGAFIDAAEDSGLIVDVGQKVLREACRAAARWVDVGRGNGSFHVAVNLSAKQLTRGGMVEVVRAALADSGAAPGSLMLEVTESAVMSDVDAAVATLQELRDLGVAIAVDDFGTGYSSLTYLKRFPVTALKIDRSFVSGLGSNADDAAIVTSVINLARAMELDCVAEGVETEQQRLVLQALGCSFGQGFLWSPALDLPTFEAWLGGAAVPDTTSLRPRAHTTPDGVADRFSSAAPRARATGPDPAVVAQVSELSGKGASLATIAAALNADRQMTAHGKRWTGRSVAHLIATQPPA